MSEDAGAKRTRLPVWFDIEQLHLHGFPEHARAAVLAEFERELSAVLDARGPLGAAAGHIHLDSVRLQCASSASMEHAAREAARNLFAQVQSHTLSQASGSGEPPNTAATPKDSNT